MKFDFVTSDTHFCHSNILKYTRTNLINPKLSEEENTINMNSLLINNWNSIVGKNDKVLHLGDFGFTKSTGDYTTLMDIVKRLNGKIYLLCGNHDTIEKLNVYTDIKLFEGYCGCLEQNGIIFSHMPVHPSLLNEDRFIANVHGHLHRNMIDDDRYINVSSEATGYFPVSMHSLISVIKEVKS